MHRSNNEDSKRETLIESPFSRDRSIDEQALLILGIPVIVPLTSPIERCRVVRVGKLRFCRHEFLEPASGIHISAVYDLAAPPQTAHAIVR